jgi:6-phosphogluconolactonase (cycloisomerase 2 family)
MIQIPPLKTLEKMPAQKKIRFGVIALSLSSLVLLSSCGRFFIKQTGGGSSTCTNCVYIANSTTDDVSQFAVTNPLTVVSSTNASAGVQPSSITVSPTDPYVFLGSVSEGILFFPIDTGGVLGTVTTASTSVGPYAMTVDPTGAWLLTASLDTSATGTGCPAGEVPYLLSIFAIGDGGALGDPASLPSTACGSTTVAPTDLVISPNGNYIFMSIGNQGVLAYTFDTSSGTATTLTSPIVGSATTNYNGVAVDPTSTYLFVSSSGSAGGLSEYMISNGQKVGSTQSPIDSFYAVAVPAASSGNYVYVSDRSTGKIYGFSYSSTALTALSGSPYSPTSTSQGTTAMVIDSSSKYVLTINSQSGPNLQQFSIGTTGALTATSTGTTSSGSYYPVALAVTASGS